MKPISLTISAFGPYLNTTTVDFEKLNEAGLFLITGTTGGGKTTLLDAMCMALYNRSTGGRRSFLDMRSLTADSTQPTKVEFTFLLGNEQYRFSRMLYMRKKRGTDTLVYEEQHECSKLCGEAWEVQASGAAKTVTDYAHKLLSLTAEQFSQVIVLPQGEFLRLLRANSKEKGEILKTLFSCEAWQRVVTRLGDRQKSLNIKRQNHEAMLHSVLDKHGARDAAELSEQINTIRKEHSEMQKKLELGSKKSNELSELLNDARSYELAKKETAIAENQVKTSEKQLADAKTKMDSSAQMHEQLNALKNEQICIERDVQILKNERERSAEKSKTETLISSCNKSIEGLKSKNIELDGVRAGIVKSIEGGERYLSEISSAAELLPVLLNEKSKLENTLKSLTAYLNARNEYSSAERLLNERKERALKEKLSFTAQDKAVSAAEAIFKANSAAVLAAELQEGVPCPVCGAIHHPKPASYSSEVITEEDIKHMKQQLDKLRKIYISAENDVSAAKAALDIAAKQLDLARVACDAQNDDPDSIKKALSDCCTRLSDAEKKAAHRSAAEKKLQMLRSQAEKVEKDISDNASKLSAANAELEQLTIRLGEYADVRAITALDKLIAEKQARSVRIISEQTVLETEVRTASDAYAGAAKLLSAANERLASAKAALGEFKAKPLHSSAEYTAEAEKLQKELRELSVLLGSRAEALKSTEETLSAVNELNSRTAQLDEEYSRVTRLHGLLSGQKNVQHMPILQYVLSVMLEETIHIANQYFSVFSRGRYALRRMTAPKSGTGYSGLDLEVLDGMSGTCRSIETLSGGEQFLASLSLAFGLSEVVQSNSGVVRMDSIFIDEGFGSLDGDTLDTAMKALETIRRTGRVVGIISHVSELRHRIPTMINVKNNENGTATARVIAE